MSDKWRQSIVRQRSHSSAFPPMGSRTYLLLSLLASSSCQPNSPLLFFFLLLFYLVTSLLFILLLHRLQSYPIPSHYTSFAARPATMDTMTHNIQAQVAKIMDPMICLVCMYVYVYEKEVKSVTLLSKIALLSILGLAEGLA